MRLETSDDQAPFLSQSKRQDRKPLLVASITLALVILTYLSCLTTPAKSAVGLWNTLPGALSWNTMLWKKKRHDYGAFKWHADLPDWDDRAGKGGRLIVIGDVHGMHVSLKQLLGELEYVQSKDTLVFVGDLIGKHPSLKASLDTISYIRSLGALAVRGNHDQSVISWRAYFQENRRSLSSLPPLSADEVDEFDYSTWADLDSDPSTLANWSPRPKDWEYGSEHFKLARRMSSSNAHWLANLPLTIHVKPLHTYIVHAGMLPFTSRPSTIAPAQPIDQTPDLLLSQSPDHFTPIDKATEDYLHASYEHSLLLIKQNRDPYTLIELRGLRKGGRVTKNGNKGKAWWKVWNKAMKQCGVFEDTLEIERLQERQEGEWDQDQENKDSDESSDSDDDQEDEDDDDDDEEDHLDEEPDLDEMRKGKTCRKLNIIYGHWKAQGLQLKKHTYGLDTGAVYGDALTALVVHPQASYEVERKSPHLKIKNINIEGRKAIVASLPCKKPKA